MSESPSIHTQLPIKQTESTFIRTCSGHTVRGFFYHCFLHSWALHVQLNTKWSLHPLLHMPNEGLCSHSHFSRARMHRPPQIQQQHLRCHPRRFYTMVSLSRRSLSCWYLRCEWLTFLQCLHFFWHNEEPFGHHCWLRLHRRRDRATLSRLDRSQHCKHSSVETIHLHLSYLQLLQLSHALLLWPINTQLNQLKNIIYSDAVRVVARFLVEGGLCHGDRIESGENKLLGKDGAL